MSEAVNTVTVLTPPGRGAVASVSVEGLRAAELVEHHFASASGKRLTELPLRRIVFGRWITDEGPGEELVVCRLADDLVEVHCHGGTAAVEAIVTSLVKAGGVRRSVDRWTHDHSTDLIQAEARLALAEAKTERTALILLDQFHGALRCEVEAIIACLQQEMLTDALHRLSQLQERFRAGSHLISPWRIAITGSPNVGKSSLMNALVGYSRSIVFDQPGTTRDLVTAETAFDGWPVQLVDTAGLRETEDLIESEGVDRTRQASREADLRLLVNDTVDFASSSRSKCSEHTNDSQCLAVLNKIDLRTDRDELNWPGVGVSAKTSQGLENLRQVVIARLIGVPPAPGDPVPFTSRQGATLAQAEHATEENDIAAAIFALGLLLG